METKEMLQYIDHTLLKPVCTWDEIEALCKEALSYHTASVCIPPSYVKRAREAFGPELPICTVIGFPLGYNPAEVKVCEARTALRDGADELDMVINLGDVKNRDFEKVYEEIRALRETAGSRILKVIVETCYLTRDEKIRLCEIVTKAGADYIKTSTGFGTAGATMEDILLFKEHIGSSVKIKAAGGIRTREDLEAFIQAGCSRIGTSSAVKLLCSSAE
ncbi:deoxyribose-phosphate aldolase [Mordavella massiliensis]|uniref:Deoxyribose-phosphate aldolase n=1 Tax=Mordavella massiliensis TaxID=1871024 RepID=A0A938X1D1_9CLOT|nr:deoxyribose-phosphate aldolase [Mordavella massiliensis]MBM6827446.1 deoxyribose-phosphate aldolase [Mordavella massiliensis]